MTDGTAANQIAALSLLLADDQLMAITRTTGLSPGAASAATDEITAFRVCRLCDAEACETCPVEAAFEDA